MSAKPTGVFVRLPVTDEQAEEMYRAYCAAYASSSLTTRGIATQAALLAIGTPVTGGDMQVFDIVDAAYGNANEKYVRQSDAQAQIAALEAEVVRLRGDAFFDLARTALAAADAAAWRPIASAPKDGTEIIACGTQTFDAGCDPEPFTNIICWSGNMWQDGTIADQPKPTHWQPLPTPPNAIPQAAPDTITIPEVRNDRPIEV
jgi:hypothetical protein